MVTWRTFRAINASIRYMMRVWQIIRHKHGFCPRCGGVLIVRKGKYGEFLGCSNYPKCNYTMDLSNDKKMREKE